VKSLDLTNTSPRSPREKLVGLVFIPRTIDKMRALLPGGNTGKYHVDGASLALLEQIGVDPAQFQELVASAASDGDIAAWLQEHADLSHCAGINERFLTIGQATASRENIKNFVADLEPEIAESRYATFSEALDRDDVAYLKACATL
jgi:hypothetical protein